MIFTKHALTKRMVGISPIFMGISRGMNTRTNIACIPIMQDIDVSSVHLVKYALAPYLASECRCIVLDLRSVSYIDSAGMGLLWASIKRVKAYGGTFRLFGVQPQVLRALRLCRMLDFLQITPQKSFTHGFINTSTELLWKQVIEINTSDLAATRARLKLVLDDINCSEDTRFDLMCAIGEAVGNVFDHAECTCATITCEVFEDRVVIDISDCGKGYDPQDYRDSRDCCDNNESSNPFAERGRGIQLMRILVDEMSIQRRTTHHGTRVHLVKVLPTSNPA